MIPQVSQPQRETFQLQARGTKSSIVDSNLMNNNTLKVDHKEKEGETSSPAARKQAEAQAKRRK